MSPFGRSPALLLLLFLTGGCSDDPPSLRNLQYAPNAGNVGVMETINGTADYTDVDNDISQSQLEMITPSGISSVTSLTPIMNVGMGVTGSVSFTVMGFQPAEMGLYHFNFWIVDLLGRPSNRLNGVLRVAP